MRKTKLHSTSFLFLFVSLRHRQWVRKMFATFCKSSCPHTLSKRHKINQHERYFSGREFIIAEEWRSKTEKSVRNFPRNFPFELFSCSFYFCTLNLFKSIDRKFCCLLFLMVSRNDTTHNFTKYSKTFSFTFYPRLCFITVNVFQQNKL